MADILDLDPRTLRRWKARFEASGSLGLYDRRRQPSRRRAPALEVQRVLRLYRETYVGFNIRTSTTSCDAITMAGRKPPRLARPVS